MYLFREIFTMNLRDMKKKGLVNGQLYPLGPCWGTWRGGGVRLLGFLIEKENIYLGSFFLDLGNIKS